MRAPITDKHLLEMMWDRFPEIMKRGIDQPAQQEPVAQWQKRHPHHWEGKWENTNEHDAKWWRDNSQGWEIRPLYTSPPAQRKPWVGLTDEEIDQGLLRSDYAFKTAEAWRAGVVFAMTKLKEKNA